MGLPAAANTATRDVDAPTKPRVRGGGNGMRELPSPGTWTGSGVLGGHQCRRPPSGGLLLVRGVVCLVVHRLEPGGGVAAVRALLEDGAVAHERDVGRDLPKLPFL